MQPRRPPIETLHLPAVLDLQSAAALQQQFLAVRGQALRVDAGNVERVGGLGLQVLLAAQAAWQADNQKFSVEKISREVAAGLKLLGVPAGSLSDGEG